MAAKLVVYKTIRPNTNVPFFVQSADQKEERNAAIIAAGAPAVVGERTYANGLKKVRTLFFPALDHYNAWKANATVAQLHADRDAYNAANGITETKHEVDMPNYRLN